MSEKFKHLYKIESARKPGWDYSKPAQYFVTICTKDKECFFGEITDGAMNLSDIGKIAQEVWLSIPEHFDFVKLHASIVIQNKESFDKITSYINNNPKSWFFDPNLGHNF